MANAQAAARSARELGANNEPTTQLSLKLAQDQIVQAQQAMQKGDNKHADSLLIRAKADAELAIAQTREKGANVERQRAVEDSAKQEDSNFNQGEMK